MLVVAGMIRFEKKDLDDGYKDKKVADDVFIDLIFEERFGQPRRPERGVVTPCV